MTTAPIPPDDHIGITSPLPEQLGLTAEVRRLNELISQWIADGDSAVTPLLEWQLVSSPKHFRPVTLFACHQSMTRRAVPPRVMRSAVALEVIHNVSLIIDDILDHSRYRRDRLSLHCRFGTLPALMTSGWMFAGVVELVASDPYAVRLLGRLMQRLGVAECRQWNLRREPLGVEDWRLIAGEDTGVMFETAACLGTRDDRLRAYGRALGILYHGCDDVADVRGAVALGGGGEEDVRDRIVTLPAAIAIRDPEIAVRFRSLDPSDDVILTRAFGEALPEAERELDLIAAQAIDQARRYARHPEQLIRLVEHTRQLSGR